MALREYILHNFWWKLLSLLLAGLTWLTIETAFRKDETLKETPVVTTSKRSFPSVAVTLMTAAGNSNRYIIHPALAYVVVSGTLPDLEKLQPRDVKAFVDIIEAGDEKEFRRNIQAQVPGDLKVVSVNPTNASVERITSPK